MNINSRHFEAVMLLNRLLIFACLVSLSSNSSLFEHFKSVYLTNTEAHNISTKVYSEQEKQDIVLKAKKYISFAGASHFPEEEIRSWSCRKCNTELNGTVVYKSLSTDPNVFGFVAYNRDLKLIVASFKGADLKKNWFDVININLVAIDNEDKIRVHSGFLELFELISNEFIEAISYLKKENPGYKVLLTGHSMGGALACMGFYKLGKEKIVKWKDLELYTYGQPKVGNGNFAQFINNNSNNVFRLTTHNDAVPLTPSKTFGYYHFDTEIHIKEDKNIFCSNNILEDKACYNRSTSSQKFILFPSIGIEHHIYWGSRIQ